MKDQRLNFLTIRRDVGTTHDQIAKFESMYRVSQKRTAPERKGTRYTRLDRVVSARMDIIRTGCTIDRVAKYPPEVDDHVLSCTKVGGPVYKRTEVSGSKQVILWKIIVSLNDILTRIHTKSPLLIQLLVNVRGWTTHSWCDLQPGM